MSTVSGVANTYHSPFFMDHPVCSSWLCPDVGAPSERMGYPLTHTVLPSIPEGKLRLVGLVGYFFRKACSLPSLVLVLMFSGSVLMSRFISPGLLFGVQPGKAPVMSPSASAALTPKHRASTTSLSGTPNKPTST